MKAGNIVRGLVVALVALGTAAVTRADEKVVVHIPFSFIVGTAELPAGEYVVTENFGDNDNVVAINSATRSSSIERGLPGRSSSYNPLIRRSMKRRRHLPTVAFV